MNLREVVSQMAFDQQAGRFNEVQGSFINLVNKRAKLDRWFDRFLDQYEEVMDTLPKSHAVWKLYTSKSNEYSDLVQSIKIAEYYIKKDNNV